MFTHILHFRNNDEMGYAYSALDCYIQPVTSSEEEFNGDALYEVVFTTKKAIPSSKIKRIKEELEPKDFSFNINE